MLLFASLSQSSSLLAALDALAALVAIAALAVGLSAVLAGPAISQVLKLPELWSAWDAKSGREFACSPMSGWAFEVSAKAGSWISLVARLECF